MAPIRAHLRADFGTANVRPVSTGHAKYGAEGLVPPEHRVVNLTYLVLINFSAEALGLIFLDLKAILVLGSLRVGNELALLEGLGNHALLRLVGIQFGLLELVLVVSLRQAVVLKVVFEGFRVVHLLTL